MYSSQKRLEELKRVPFRWEPKFFKRKGAPAKGVSKISLERFFNFSKSEKTTALIRGINFFQRRLYHVENIFMLNLF